MEQLIIFITVFGGLGLFLLGMDLLSSGMKNLAGRKIRNILAIFLKDKPGAVTFGVLLTLLFQSSSAASVVLIGFVDASIITFQQTLPVLLGSGIGTTITAQLISFNIGQLALLFIGIGVIMKSFTPGNWSKWGQIILGLGILFFGMKMMTDGLMPLRDNEVFINVLLHLENPVAGLLVGLVFTALIQSSAAFIGILITLCNSNLITFDASLPLIIGTNIGTTVTALIASTTATYPGRKLAVANAIFRLLGALLFIGFLGPWGDLIVYITGQAAPVARLLANAHTFFNIVMAVMLLPFTNAVGNLVTWLVPVPKKAPVHSLHYLNKELLSSPDLSMPFLHKELQDMGEVVHGMVKVSMRPFLDRDEMPLELISKGEERADFYRDEINKFMSKLNESNPVEQWSEEMYRMMHVVNELEQIADIVSVNMARQAEKWLASDLEFSPEGRAELEMYHSQCLKQLERALTLMDNWDPTEALQMKKKYRKYALMAFDIERKHYKRLFAANSKTLESSKVHMELLNLLRIINSRATNFGRLVFMAEEQMPMV